MAIILRMTIFFALLIWGIVAMLYPSATFMEVITWLGSTIASIIVVIMAAIFVDVPLWFFNTFYAWIPASGQEASFLTLLQMGVAIALAISIPVLWCFTMSMIIIGTLYLLLPTNVRMGIAHSSSPEIENMKHLVNGRTTVQNTFDAQVQANEIVAALQRTQRHY